MQFATSEQIELSIGEKSNFEEDNPINITVMFGPKRFIGFIEEKNVNCGLTDDGRTV